MKECADAKTASQKKEMKEKKPREVKGEGISNWSVESEENQR